MSTRNTLLAFGVLVLTACGGGAHTDGVAPLGSPEAAVREFLAAVQDSNIVRMGRAWGSSSGPSAVTNSPDRWQERLKVVQIYLRGGNYQVTGNTADPGDAKHRNLVVDFTRGNCVKHLPVVAVQSKRGGWLVESIDISQAGSPRNPCPSQPAAPASNP